MNQETRILPNDLELENAVLGAILIDKTAFSKVGDILSSEVFYHAPNPIIFDSCKRLFEKSEPIDILTVFQDMVSFGTSKQLPEGPYSVKKLTDRVANAENLEYHCHVMKECYIRREMIKENYKNIDRCFDMEEDVFETIEKQERSLIDLSRDQFKKREESYSSLYFKDSKDIENSRENNLDSGILTGLHNLDRILCGLKPGEVTVIAARPGQGKTALALTIAKNASAKKIPVLFFTLEMTNPQITKRLISMEADIPLNYLISKRIEGHYVDNYQRGLVRSTDYLIWFDDTNAPSVFEMKAKAGRAVRELGVGLIVIDYIQLATDGRAKGNATLREQEISYISRSIKGMAKDLNIPILELAQLSRGPENRENKRPQLSDLRESGSIEQDADVVIFLVRPALYGFTSDQNGQPLKEGHTDVIIAKHRNGATGDVSIKFEGEYTRFVNEVTEQAEIKPRTQNETDNIF